MASVSPLSDLILTVQQDFEDRHGVKLSLRDIERRAGGGIVWSNVGRMVKQPIKEMPLPDTLRALARGLGVSEALVTLRALQSAGYVVPTSDTDLTGHRKIG